MRRLLGLALVALAAPALAGPVSFLASNGTSSPASVAPTPSGQVACINTENSVAFYDMATGALIDFRTAGSLPSGVRQSAMSATRAIFLRENGHFIFDVTGDALTEVAANVTSASGDVQLTLDGAVACINTTNSCAFYDMSTGALIDFHSATTGTSGMRQVAVTDTRTIFLRSGGHLVFDMTTNPPTQIAANVTSSPGDVMLTPDGSMACLNLSSSVAFYDMSTGALIDFTSAGSSTSGVRQIAMNATRAIFLRASGHYIFDITTNPPTQISATVTSTPEDVMLTPDGTTACINTANSVAFYDMATGAFLGSRSMGSPPHGVRQIAMSDTRGIFLRNGGNIVFDVTTTPPAEILANSSSLSSDVELTPDGSIAFVQTENAVVYYDMETGNLIDFYTTSLPSGVRQLLVTDDRAVALRENGILVFNIGEVTGVADGVTNPGILAQNVPNPMRGSTDIEFTTDLSGHVSLEIFDVSGRRVRSLVGDVRAPGVHRARWDGRDARGARVPAGTYFYRVETPNTTEERRLTVVR